MATKDYEDLSEKLRQDALAAAASQSPGTAPTYAGTYEDQLSELFDKIQNREPFKYDINADPLYDMYKDKYVTQGKLAMKDAMGQAAGLTGGYGSSYGQQVGQQAYGAYLQNLSDVIPQLYGMAYDMYQDKGNELQNQYGLVGQMRDTEYNRYRDELGDWNYQQELARALEEQEYNRRLAEEESAYSRQQKAYSNLVALIRASGYNPSNQELKEAGLTREAANALRNEYIRSITPVTTTKSSGGGGGGGGGGGSSSKKTTTTAKTTTQNDSFYNSTKPTVVSNVTDVVRSAADALAKGTITVQEFGKINSTAINSILNNTRKTDDDKNKKTYGGAGGH